MKDEILKGFVTDFAEQKGISDLNFDVQFEHFVNFCIISKQYPRDFDFEDLSVGGGQDSAIDGVAITVNGNIILDKSEVLFFKEKNGTLSVSFSFIQSKTSSHFNGAQIVNFLSGIKNFFREISSIPENNDIIKLRDIKNTIYSNSISMYTPPTLELYFVTTGEWKEPEHINGLIKNELAEIDSKGLFDSIKFTCIDSSKLKQMYRDVRGRSLKEIELPQIVSLPEIIGVRQSFVGSVSLTEYIKLITDSDGSLQKNLFYDNVRDFQGNNSVNQEIDKTLKSEGQAALSIYNNGITIIAKKVDRISGKIKLTDYQIVNGCQTSHVIFENKEKILPGTNIIVKIIETTDQDVAANVIKATNRQTEVKTEAFESLSPFHKDLEELFRSKSKDRPNKIYYERRSKQYENIPNIRNSQIITLSAQIKSFVSACLAQPQSTHRYFGEILDSNRSRMFNEGDSLDKYYNAAATLNRIETLFKNRKIKFKYKQFKYHIVYLIYTFQLKAVSSKHNLEKKNFLDFVDDDVYFLNIVEASCKIIDSAQKKLNVDDQTRSKVFTDTISSMLNENISKL